MTPAPTPAANANVATEEGGARATVLISEALSEQTASVINCTSADESGANGLAVVAVTCSGAIPSVVTALGSLLPIDVTARVIAEGQ